jgi:ABC-type Fe3+-hydroxamate transport system substrate-binding protein
MTAPLKAALSAPRLASLVPSLTELVVELGLGAHLVARTGFCIHPADRLASVPKVGGTKDVNLAKLQRLAPTHVMVNVDENRLETVEAIRGWPAASVPEIIVTHPGDPADNLELVDQVARQFAALPGVETRAEGLKFALARELALTSPETHRPRRVLYLIWREPWMTVARDTYISRMLARIGWQTLPAVLGGASGAARYPVVDVASPWLADVEEVLLSSEPYRFGPHHRAEAQALCPAARIRLVDGELISWYGPRAVAGLRYLREQVAP